MMKYKTLDCVKMKLKLQEELYNKTKDLTLKEFVEFVHNDVKKLNYDKSLINLIYNIPVKLKLDDNNLYVVYDDIINMYGTGETYELAYKGYQETVANYYDWLVTQGDNLAYNLKEHYIYLKLTYKKFIDAYTDKKAEANS